MKLIAKKILKTSLVFIVSTIILYLILTLGLFYSKCSENKLKLFNSNYSDDLSYIDKDTVQKIGDSIAMYAQALDASLEESPYKDDGINHTLGDGHQHSSAAEVFDPLGFSVWSHIQIEVSDLSTRYISISILSGVAITIAYVIITSKKMNNILKFVIGYLGVMLIIPPIYMYSFTYKFWDLVSTYSNTPMYFYIGYTTIFLLMYIINYRIGVKVSKELNEAIKLSKITELDD